MQSRRGRKGVGVVECGRGPGIYARRSHAYVRVFVYLCGTPENPTDVREMERKKERGREREGERKRESAQRAREEPSPVKGKDEDGGKSQWPAKVCCPFVTRERVGTLERASDYAARTPGNKRQPSHHHHHHIATPPHRHAAHRTFLFF